MTCGKKENVSFYGSLCTSWCKAISVRSISYFPRRRIPSHSYEVVGEQGIRLEKWSTMECSIFRKVFLSFFPWLYIFGSLFSILVCEVPSRLSVCRTKGDFSSMTRHRQSIGASWRSTAFTFWCAICAWNLPVVIALNCVLSFYEPLRRRPWWVALWVESLFHYLILETAGK